MIRERVIEIESVVEITNNQLSMAELDEAVFQSIAETIIPPRQPHATPQEEWDA